MQIFLSTGAGFNSVQEWFDSGSGSYTAAGAAKRVAAGDFNGDGECDLATIYDAGGTGNYRNFGI